VDAPIVVDELYEVAPGHEADFYSWGTALIQVIARVDGYLGGDVRDPEWTDGEWQIVHRWADRELAAEWEASTTRARWLAAAQSFARPRPPRERLPRAPAASPAEAPEPPPAAPPGPPPKWKMAVVTLLAVFPPVLFFNVTLIPQLSNVSVILRTLVLCVGVTVVVTWVMMPRLMRLFKGWLHPAGPRRRIGAPLGGATPAESAPNRDAALPPAESFPRFRPAEPISGRSTFRTQPDTRTVTLDPTDPYPRRNR
jgi:antibiotic biosynthesis monooxygenase (ABM) superfamily enzyme